MATSSRESRRRKILERGSDRLSLITGRVPYSSSAPTPLPSQLPHVPETDSPKPLIAHEARRSDQTTVSPNGSDKGEVDSPDSMLLKEDRVADARNISAYHDERSIKSPLPESETSIEALSAPASVVSGKEQSSLISPSDQNSSVTAPSRKQYLEPQRDHHKFFNPSQISAAISATECARLLCSVAIALLVVLSHLGFPVLGSSIIKSILSFRPLYLVLLTNVTVVLSQLLFDNQGGSQRDFRGENNSPSTNAYGWAAQASKGLEVGFMMQKMIDAVFMDCSVYSIILVSALCFSKQFSQ